jgi:hypothetical protein
MKNQIPEWWKTELFSCKPPNEGRQINLGADQVTTVCDKPRASSAAFMLEKDAAARAKGRPIYNDDQRAKLVALANSGKKPKAKKPRVKKVKVEVPVDDYKATADYMASIQARIAELEAMMERKIG